MQTFKWAFSTVLNSIWYLVIYEPEKEKFLGWMKLPGENKLKLYQRNVNHPKATVLSSVIIPRLKPNKVVDEKQWNSFNKKNQIKFRRQMIRDMLP